MLFGSHWMLGYTFPALPWRLDPAALKDQVKYTYHARTYAETLSTLSRQSAPLST